MDQIIPDTALDGTIYMGPFFTKDGRYFYRDTHNQIWELSPTGWLDLPLTIEAVTKIWDPNPKGQPVTNDIINLIQTLEKGEPK